MTNKIVFKAINSWASEVCPKPFPAASSIPQWWKDEPPYEPSEYDPKGKKLIVQNHVSNATFKKCTPMLDSLTSGYLIPLFADIQVLQTENGPYLSWRTVGGTPFSAHGNSSASVERPSEYDIVTLKYFSNWVIQTPPGYSCLIVHPYGYRNLPFRAVEAVMDTDKTQHELVLPMWIKKGFEGIVEVGTPMCQVIPFKRESWKAEFDQYPDGDYKKVKDKTIHATIINNYVKHHWSKKSYK